MRLGIPNRFNEPLKYFGQSGPLIRGLIQTYVEIYVQLYTNEGARGGVLVKALRYKPAGRGFDSRWCH